VSLEKNTGSAERKCFNHPEMMFDVAGGSIQPWNQGGSISIRPKKQPLMRAPLRGGKITRSAFGNRFNPFFMIVGFLEFKLSPTFNVRGCFDRIGEFTAYLFAQ